MGCANSKRSHCQHCKRPYSPHDHSPSLAVHQPVPIIKHRSKSQRRQHLVDLASTTLGSLQLDSIDQNQLHFNEKIKNNEEEEEEEEDQKYTTTTIITTTTTTTTKKKNSTDSNSNSNSNNSSKEISNEVKQAESWSNKITNKLPKIIPKTPSITPPGEPETINTWELMEGLDEDSSSHRKKRFDRGFSFHTECEPTTPRYQAKDSKPKLEQNEMATPIPGWLQIAEESMADSNSIISDFDPEIISTFRKALEELRTPLRSPERERTISPCNSMFFMKEPMETKKAHSTMTKASKCPPFGEEKVVIYFTTLRGVRKTYEDCCYARMILKGTGVRIDERDVSMHYLFRLELQELLGGEFNGQLPKVFVKGHYIGGAEEVKQMHEDGELENAVEGCEMVEEGSEVCEMCGDVRFVPCETCSGSCKVYYEEDEYEGEEDGYEGEGGGFQRCPDCNENGIVRCPVCCYS